MPFLLEILILPLLAFLSGNLFNRWWNRGMPLLVLQGFSTFVDETSKVKYTAELKKMSMIPGFFYQKGQAKKLKLPLFIILINLQKALNHCMRSLPKELTIGFNLLNKLLVA